ncbi:cytochrome P450 3A24-like [Rhopilema esculentum]|uniref:cytochrome P450 3A24-like n=1 Tax=Rhopilema esculentum TaxID=499914 RepID=UPI0031E3BDD4|eukprot:gene15851-7177_t
MVVSNLDDRFQTGLLVSFLVFAATVVCYWLFVRPFSFFKRYGIPHPQYSHLTGNVSDLMRQGTSVYFIMSNMKKFGNIFGFYLGRNPHVVVADPSVLEVVFVKEFSNFHNRRVPLGTPKSPMHLNMIVAEYKDWKKIRPTVSPTFSASKIKQTIPLVMQSVDTLANLLTKHAEKEETINIFKLYGQMTMEVILSVAFGLKTDYQLNEDKQISEEASHFFSPRPAVLIIDLFPLPKFITDRLKTLFAPDPTFFVNLLKPVVEERKKNASVRKDFLQLLLAENKVDGQLKLGDTEIYASAITFLLAGYETTSNALAYTTYLLALHPEIQERLYNEVKDCDMNSEDGKIYEDIQKLDYLDAVFNESLRFYPPAWQTLRRAENDIVLGKYKIPRDTTISVPIFVIHHSEQFWKDPEKFDPERFSPERKGDIIPYTFLPFGHGPRNCVGMRFALIEAKLTLITLLKKFRFVKTKETEPQPLKLTFGVTMSPANGINIRVIQR